MSGLQGKLPQITSALRATFRLAAGFAIWSEILLGFAAPIDAAGKFVVRRAGRLVIHLLRAKMATGNFNAAERNGLVFHRSPQAAAWAASKARFTAVLTN